MERITKRDLAELILILKQQTNWSYIEMGEVTGIHRASLQKYATKRDFPRDPVMVVNRLKAALKEYTKEKMREAK